MTRKNFYIVFGAKAGYLFQKPDKETFYADVLKVSSMDDIAYKLETIGGLLHANICVSKREAEEIKATWNEAYKNNGTYAF